MLQIYGVPFSAHTRKVIIAAREKGLEYELVPLIPLRPDLPEAFLNGSPLRKIPMVLHDGEAVADSTVIALYLDRVFADRPLLYPAAPAEYARALFVEELVDGALAQHVLHGLLFQRVFRQALLDEPPDETLIAASLHRHIPDHLDHLEARLSGEWFAGPFSYADVTVVSILLNFHYAGEVLDGTRYPKLAAWLQRALNRESVHGALAAEAGAARGIPGMDTQLLDRLGY